jgi:hypothetical protein
MLQKLLGLVNKVQKTIANNNKKTYYPLYYLLDDIANNCDAYANFLQKRNSISLIHEFQEDLGEHYKNNVGIDLKENVSKIASQLRDVSYKLNDMIFVVEKIIDDNDE